MSEVQNKKLDNSIVLGARNCDFELLKVLTSIIGKKMAKLILFQKMHALGIYDLDDSSEYDQKILITELFQDNLLKILNDSEIKNLKLILFTKLYGRSKAQKLLYEDFNIKTKKPLDFTKKPLEFIYSIFGKTLGNILIKNGQKEFDVGQIKKRQEYKQMIFMEQLLKIMFDGSSKEMCDSIKLSMVKFVKLGDKSEIVDLGKLLKKFNIEPKELVHQFKQRFELMGAKEEVDKLEFDDVADFLDIISDNNKTKKELFDILRKDSLNK